MYLKYSNQKYRKLKREDNSKRAWKMIISYPIYCHLEYFIPSFQIHEWIKIVNAEEIICKAEEQ